MSIVVWPREPFVENLPQRDPNYVFSLLWFRNSFLYSGSATGFLVLDSWFWIPCFGLLVCNSWFWIPEFGFPGLDSWVWIPGFGFLGLDFWAWIPGFGFLG